MTPLEVAWVHTQAPSVVLRSSLPLLPSANGPPLVTMTEIAVRAASTKDLSDIPETKPSVRWARRRFTVPGVVHQDVDTRREARNEQLTARGSQRRARKSSWLLLFATVGLQEQLAAPIHHRRVLLSSLLLWSQCRPALEAAGCSEGIRLVLSSSSLSRSQSAVDVGGSRLLRRCTA